MTAINGLRGTDTLSPGDLVAVYSTTNGGTRKAPASAFVDAIGQSYVDQAEAQADAATATVSAFQNLVYPGVYAVDPTTRPNGSAIQDGDRAVVLVGGVPTEKLRVLGAWIVPNISSVNLALPSGAGLVGFGYGETYPAGTVGDAIKDFGESSGSSLVGFLQAGTGAYQRDIQSKLREWIDALDYIDPAEHAAIYAGTTTYDSGPGLQNAANAAIAQGKGLRMDSVGLLKIATAVDLRNIRNIDIRANIQVDPAIVAVPVTVGGFASGGTCSWRFADVTDGTSLILAAPPARPIFRVFGVKSSDISIGGCNYLQFWADSAVASGNSNGYCRVYLNGVHSKLELTDTGSGAWNNENRFYGGRIIRLSLIGVGYPHNHNKFYEPTLEGTTVSVTHVNVSTNEIIGARLENTSAAPGVTYDATSYSNSLVSSWSGVGNPRAQFSPAIPVADSGMGNMVTTDSAFRFTKTKITSVSAASLIVANASDSIANEATIANDGYTGITTKQVLTPSLIGFEAIANRLITLTGFIPVQNGDAIVFNGDYDGSLLRARIYVFDSNKQPITSEGVGGAYVDSPSFVFNAAGHYTHSADRSAVNLNASACAIVRPEVKYIRFGYFSATGGLFRSISAYLFTQSMGRGVTEADAAPRCPPRFLIGAPTKSYVPRGYQLFESGGKIHYWVTFSYETTTNGALAAGATSVTVTAISTVANGDVCGILMDNGTTHWTTVSALAGSTFTIAAIPVGRSVASGSRIAFNRWAS